MDTRANRLMRELAGIAAAVAIATSAPAQAAGAAALELPAGRLGDAVAALAAQTGTSVSVADEAIWRMRVAALRGRMSAAEALRRLLKGSRGRLVEIGPGSFRIVTLRETTAPGAAPPFRSRPPPAGDEGDAIIVTASKRDTRLRDFPASVSLLDGAELAFGGEQGTDSILSRVASLSSTHLGAGRNKLFIRGIADSSFTGPTQATVGQYLGDVRLTYNAPDPDLRLYDIQSVEILEGPQGTLYGAGSLGGVIRIVRNPAQLGQTAAALSAGASATQHGDPSADLGAVINLPLAGDRLALRAVGYGIRDGGYIDDIRRRKNDINRTAIEGGRATLRLDGGGGWLIDVGGIYQANHGRDSQYADRDQPPLTRASRVPGGFDADYALGELVVAKRWDSGIALLSSSALVGQQLDERYDASLANGPERQFAQRSRTRMFATENRLWRPNHHGYGWVLGASYTDNRTRLYRALGPTGATLPVTGVVNRVREATIYGEASVEPWRGLVLTVGARHTWSRLGGGADNAVPLPAFAADLAVARAAIVASRGERRFLPSAAVSAALLPGLTVYARYQQGFRPGGLAIEGGFVRRFRNDRVATMETGLRYGVRGHDPFDVALSLSHTRWNDIQADFIDGAGLPSTDNIGDGRIYSLSLALGWRPLDALGFDFSATYNDSKVTRPSPRLLLALAGEPVSLATGARTGGQGRIPNVARFTARIGLDYRAELGDRLDLRINGWARYIGKSRLGIGPILGDLQGDYVDSALTARIGRPDLGITLGVTNLTDTIGNRFALGTPFSAANGGQITPLRPRTIRIGIDTRF